MHEKITRFIVGWFVTLGVAGCHLIAPEGAPPQQGKTTMRMPAMPPTLTVVLTATAQIAQEDTVSLDNIAPNPLVMQAMKDLAKRLAIGLDKIEIVSFAAVVWPDGSMGCPQPGMIYPQVQQDGARMRLRVGDRIYEYHSGGVRPPFLCETPSEIGVR
jgi:hypothetical protein